VGIPAKSGVSGGIVAVAPGRFGIAIYSPPLDAKGNSVRGIQFFQELSTRYGLHAFECGFTGPSMSDELKMKRVRS
jgi:glutaminase